LRREVADGKAYVGWCRNLARMLDYPEVLVRCGEKAAGAVRGWD